MIYSFLGWLMEVVTIFLESKKLVNRGFLIGPYCPIYGYGCLLIIILLHKYLEDPLVLFVMAILICSFLEYFTSYFMEKLFNARWWDYSNKRFNINGRICLETMIPFGILGTIIMYMVNPFFVGILEKIPFWILEIVAIILFIVYVSDSVISIIVINNFKNEIKLAEKDRTEEITKRVRKTLTKKGYLHKRLINAFPHFKTYKEVLKDIETRIKNLKK